MTDVSAKAAPWLPPSAGNSYIYLLGLYLGDGTIQKAGRTAQLRVFMDNRYPKIQDECAVAMTEVAAGRTVFRVQRPGCTVVTCSSIHWKCVFPQHGPGRKHTRAIKLTDWQQNLADQYPAQLLRGLIHSDGCRNVNVVKGHEYPRYSFSNRSSDIHEIFQRAATRLGLGYTVKRWTTLISRRADVSVLDALIGPKH